MTRIREDLVSIFLAAVEAAAPERLVAARLERDGDDTVVLGEGRAAARFAGPPLILAVGKAAAGMAKAAWRFYSEAVRRPAAPRGLVIVPHGTATDCPFPVRVAGHPLPDERGEAAAAELSRLVRTARESAILLLLSGGASSLLVAPRPPVTLASKVAVTRLLLGAGADIHELNTVRKHLSLLKGGGLLRMAGGRKVVTMILSDVVGDDPAVIGSGPTAADPTTCADALEILRRFGLAGRVPGAVVRLLEAGIAGEVPETVKPREIRRFDAVNLLVGSNRTALEGAAARARQLGYDVTVDHEPLTGDTTECARRRAAALITRTNRPGQCWLAGGETTVRVRGSGRGGRNQEFALALVPFLEGRALAVLSAGTDGIDGPTDAAGAFVDGTTAARARAARLDPGAALAANDSYTFFERLGDLFRCGPTGTNVIDVKIALSSVARP